MARRHVVLVGMPVQWLRVLVPVVQLLALPPLWADALVLVLAGLVQQQLRQGAQEPRGALQGTHLILKPRY